MLDAHTTLRVNEDDRLKYFATFQEGFERAAVTSGGSIDHFYSIGGHSVRMRFAGEGLVPHLTPAFAHLRGHSTVDADLTICLWDSVTTETPPPLFLSSLLYLLELRWFELLSSRREIKGYHSDRIRTMFHFGPNILSAMDTRENVAIYWIRDARTTPYYERGYPLTKILNWWTESRSLQCVHAAAVGDPEGGVLLAGKSGSGKSTTSLLCLHSQLSYVSDDTSLVAWNPDPYIFSLYNTAKLTSLQLLPHLESCVTNRGWKDGEKALMFLHEHFPHKLVHGFPLKGILLLRVSGQTHSVLRHASPMAALKALAPSTIYQFAGSGQAELTKMSRLVRQVPCYHLELGTDLREIPDLIMKVVSG
ncbi:MAG TPA: hypothetical protein VK466_04715 [Terriglobales bacterium]|nr:hypothetical protein [Terriglobales bacterium]